MNRSAVVLALSCALYASSCERMVLGPEDELLKPVAHSSALATLLDSLRYANDLPALAGAIVTDTGIVDAEAVGCHRYGGPANVKVNDQFHLGSNTKAFTAMLLGMLVDDGLTGWDSTLRSIFPEYASIMRPAYRDATIRNLLSHSAGFPREVTITLRTKTPREQRVEAVAQALVQPPAQQRGSYLYSNFGCIIAGAVAEKLANRSYEDLLVDRVLQPLGITTGGFGAMGTAGLEDQPLQHTANHAPILPGPSSDLHPIYSPAGRLHMSIGDWGKYIRWVLALEAGRYSLLQPGTARTLTAAVVPDDQGNSYALGWTITSSQWAGGRTLTHSGSNGLNFSVAWLASNRHFAMIVATNICADQTPHAMGAVSGRLINFFQNGR